MEGTPMQIDHLILNVNDARESIAFYESVLGLTHEGEDGPFSIVRVDPGFVLLLGPWGTPGGEHLAFAMTRAEFDAVLARLREKAIPYGDAFDSVGNQRGPALERGARGMAQSIYFFDPNKHLLEIRYHEEA